MAQLVKNLPTVWKIWVWIAGLGRFPGEGHWNQLQYSCLENPHGQRSLVGCSSWGCKELDTTEWLSTAQHLLNKVTNPHATQLFHLKNKWKRERKKNVLLYRKMTTIYGKEMTAETQSPKTEFPCWVHDLPRYKKAFFLVQPLFPSGLRSIKERGKWNWAGYCRGLSGTEIPPCSLFFLFAVNAFSLLGLPTR